MLLWFWINMLPSYIFLKKIKSIRQVLIGFHRESYDIKFHQICWHDKKREGYIFIGCKGSFITTRTAKRPPSNLILDARHVDAQTIQRLLAPTPTWSHGGSAPTVQLRLAKFGLHTEERLNRYASVKDIFIAAGLLSHDRVAPSLYPSRRGHHLA